MAEETPKVGSRWRHYDGTPYTVTNIANNEGDDPTKKEKYPVTIVYQGPNGKVWTRRLDDWHRSMTKEPTEQPAVATLRDPIGEEATCYICKGTIPADATDWGWCWGSDGVWPDGASAMYACWGCRDRWEDHDRSK